MRSIKYTISIALLSLLSLVALAEDQGHNVWIDVRSEAEYKVDHMEDSTLIPHTEIADGIAKLNLDKSAPIKLFCRSGGRAGMAKQTLESLGYSNVENAGGLDQARKLRAELEN
ncbi:rhodanese-like domain-containing protein [Gilvimarinus sp. F26214L]|uniref:rhodanese-like domain-containing protein n=1 Tax=Gilvimarinus sp. DZF01 TaxID=3461371 RepID=UPI0040451B2E